MPAQRILVTGAAGQLGFELARLLAAHGEVIALDRHALDLADADAIVRAMRDAKPSIVVNAAAHTAVDAAEKERELAFAINSGGPRILAEEAKRAAALLVHYSTDYVFDGEAREPYREDDPVGPRSVYGESKLEGERAIAASGAAALVFRTSWIYGLRGRNFLLTIRRLAQERDEIRVVADQHGVPNWSRVLAEATGRVIGSGREALRERAGLYHLSCGGVASWYEFARAIIGPASRPRLLPIATAEYPTAARRPMYSALSTDKFERTFGFALPHWRDALARCIEAEKGEGGRGKGATA